MIASTASLFRVQTEFSLNSFICSVIGSDVASPQIVPEEQLEVDGVVNIFDVVWKVDVGVVCGAVVVAPPPPP